MTRLYESCCAAEGLALTVPTMSCVSARSALEFTVTLVYRGLGADKPAASLFEMMSDGDFVRCVNDATLLGAMHTVRKLGNIGAHGEKVSQTEACKNLEQLQFVVGEVCINLGLIDDYPPFVSPLTSHEDAPQRQSTADQVAGRVGPTPSDGDAKEGDSPKRDRDSQTCAPTDETVAAFAERLRHTRFSTSKVRDESENKRLFVRASLREAEWPISAVANQAFPATACIDMTLQDGTKVDYVLYGRDNKPLAVVEYSSAMVNPLAGRKAALHAAELLQAKLGYRPTAYYASGYHIYCIDPLGFPPRRVFGFHSLEELDWMKQRSASRGDISDPLIDDAITNRDYQKDAIRSICKAFMNHRRRGLVVMATGTGKTRVSISLVDVLLKAGWVKNVLFLADRTSLVVQAHKNFNKLLPDVPTSIFSGTSTNRDKNARIIFSTYQTMIRMVDGDTREFGIGRFDLIVVDEAHRSIFSKYGSLFEYFDALMVGLTATPRNELNKNSYAIFQLPDGEPDYAYELEEAIQDGYLVGFSVLDRTTEAMRRGIRYDDLSDEQKQQVEDAFSFEGEEPSEDGLGWAEISVTKGNVINKGTIDVMLADLMENGIKIDAGDKLGKTFVFARSHKEAEVIVERFHQLYGSVWGADFCKLVDSQVDNSLVIIDSFAERDKLPQIAVSVDMLDTGVDVPDAVNLVIFKRVNSKIKFLQMIGRGTRLSPDLFGPGMDKKGFLAFDYYDNFRYFNANETWSTVHESAYGNKKGSKVPRSFGTYQNTLRLEIICQLQGRQHKTAFEKRYEKELRERFRVSVQVLNNDAIEVARNLGVVNKYRTEGIWDQPITKQAKEEIELHILPLLPPEHDNVKAKSFDSLVLKVESEYDRRLEEGKDPTTIRHGFTSVADEFTSRMEALLKLKTIPAVVKEEQLIAAMVDGEYLLGNFSFERAERVRLRLRDLMRYLPDRREYHIIDLPDQLVDAGESEGIGKRQSYAERAAAYLADTTNPILAKLRTLEHLSKDEVKKLEDVFTFQLGTAADYAAWSGNAPLLPYLRKQVGIAEEAVQTKLGPVIDDPALNDQQREFLHQLVVYAQANGDVSAKTLQTQSPFADIDVIGLFGASAGRLKQVIDALHRPVVA